MSAPRVILVRHGVTDWNREGRFQGHLDPPLSADGHVQAERVAGRMAADASLRPARIVSSTLARARETADAISATTGVSVEEDARLMEIGQGDWEGRTHAELEVADPEAYLAWRSSPRMRRPPGGEEIGVARERVAAVLATLDEDDAGASPVCLVSHGGTLRLVAQALLDLGDERDLEVDNASLSVLDRIGSVWRVERWNDMHHLLGLAPTHVDEAEGRPLAL